MVDEGVQLIEQKIKQAITLIEKLRAENKGLREEIARLQDEIQQLKEDAGTMQAEREELKSKIGSAVSMLDKVNMDDVLDSMAEEVAGETED